MSRPKSNQDEQEQKELPQAEQVSSIELATPEQGLGHLAETQNRVASGNPEAQQSVDTFEVVGKNVSEDPNYTHSDPNEFEDLEATDITSDPVTFDEIRERGLHIKKAEAILLHPHISQAAQHGSDPGEVILFDQPEEDK